MKYIAIAPGNIVFGFVLRGIFHEIHIHFGDGIGDRGDIFAGSQRER